MANCCIKNDSLGLSASACMPVRPPNFLPNELHVILGSSTTIGTASSTAETTSKDKDSNGGDVSTRSSVIYVTYFCAGELRTMMRPADDLMSKTLQRLTKTIAAQQRNTVGKSKAKKAKNSASDPRLVASPSPEPAPQDQFQPSSSAVTFPFVELGSRAVDTSSLTNKQFESGMKVYIQSAMPAHAGDRSQAHTFEVVVNPPTVTTINVFPRKLISTHAFVVASCDSEHSDGVEYSWYGKPVQAEGGPSDDSDADSYGCLSCDQVFVPRDEHVGYSLKVYCSPWRYSDPHRHTEHPTHSVSRVYGRTVVLYLAGVVVSRDELALMVADRQSFRDDFCRLRSTKADAESAGDGSTSIRVVTYNVLADMYASRQSSIRSMYSYVQSARYMDLEYRAIRNLTELARYAADVICLQECEMRLFDNYLRPYFHSKNYSGIRIDSHLVFFQLCRHY
jgi:hypothetical protein